jgi:8-oxo-dGTP pyrophosphatase MutT (NUDIX family)
MPNGDPAAAFRHDGAFLARARTHLDAFEPRAIPPGDRWLAAVAVVLLPDEAGRAAFLLTRRAARLRAHGGQWALPGGRLDPGETPPRAALRELAEEVGLVLDEAAVLGRLDDYATRSGFVVTPVVLWAPAADALRPNPAEVAALFRVAIADLDRPDVPRLVTLPERERPVVQVPLLGTLIHAPTAAILYQLREVVLHGRATRVAHLEEPAWATAARERPDALRRGT